MADLGIFDRIAPEKPVESKPDTSKGLGIFDRLPTTGPESKEDKGFLGTLASDVAGIIPSTVQAVRHPIDTATGLVKAQVGQGKEAAEAFKQGRYSEAFGHGLAAALPVVGPAAAQAGEELGGGQPGAGAAHAFELLAPSAGKLIPKEFRPGQLLAKPLRTAAEKTYAQVLAPGTKADKYITKAKLLTPAGRDLLQRRVMGLTEKGLHGRLERNLAQAEINLDDAWSNLGPQHQQNLSPILNGLQKRAVEEATEPIGKTQFETPGLPGRRVIDNRLYNAYQNIALEVIDSMGPVADQASSFSMRRFRQILDDRVKKSFQGGELTNAEQAATRGAADAIRQVLNSSDPSVALANREYSFWRSARDVFQHTNLRRVGQKGALNKLAAAAGGGGGAVVGSAAGPKGAVEGYLLGRIAAQKMDEVLNSTAWKTVSAVSKNRVAELLAQGKGEAALGVATRAAAYASLRTQEEQ